MAEATLNVTVARKWQEAPNIYGFEFVDAAGGALPPFSAGAHIDVHLPGGLIRQYSLCNDPAGTQHYRIAVLRDENGRGGSRATHDKVQQGAALKISAPRNHFPLAHGAPHHLLIAGGIGITPIVAMARKLEASGRRAEIHYSARGSDAAAFLAELREEIGLRRLRRFCSVLELDSALYRLEAECRQAQYDRCCQNPLGWSKRLHHNPDP